MSECGINPRQGRDYVIPPMDDASGGAGTPPPAIPRCAVVSDAGGVSGTVDSGHSKLRRRVAIAVGLVASAVLLVYCAKKRQRFEL